MQPLPWVVINDLHIGAIRSGGTTTATALKLRQDLLYGMQTLVGHAEGCNLLINGDLFDATNVLLVDLYAAMHILGDWLARNPSSSLCLPPGNHDLSKNTEHFSSFDFLANYLRAEYPHQVMVPREGGMCLGSIKGYVIPHMPNQDLFDLELAKVPECNWLFLHCNYDNGFAAKSDHSLNLSDEQAIALNAGCIVIAHEHQRKLIDSPNVVVLGNQMPSSVADCLGNDQKFALRIDPKGIVGEYIPTWDAEGSFAQLDWRELEDTGADFIRVIGSATSAEAAAVVQAISKFRQRSKALVITNAVSIEGVETNDMEVSLEQIQAFDVMAELMKFLNEEERGIVAELLEKNNG